MCAFEWMESCLRIKVSAYFTISAAKQGLNEKVEAITMAIVFIAEEMVSKAVIVKELVFGAIAMVFAAVREMALAFVKERVWVAIFTFMVKAIYL